MKSLKWMGTLAATLCLFAGTARGQAPAGAPAAPVHVVVVAEPATIGVDPGTGAAFADLLRGELARQSGWAVIPRSSTPQQPCGDAGCGQALAQQTGAAGAVTMSMSQLGQKVVVNITFVWIDGRVLFSDRVSAATPEDLDPLSKRAAWAIATGKPIGETATVTTVTEEEAKPMKRKPALMTGGVRIGGLFPLADSFGGAGPMSSFGFLGIFEMTKFAIELGFDFQWPFQDEQDVSAGGIMFNLGGLYFLSEADQGMYLSGGFGYRYAVVDVNDGDFNSDGAGGLGLYLGGGVMFFRTSDIHVILDVRYDIGLYKFDEPNPGNDTAHGLMVNIGFTYKGLGRRWF